MLQRLHLAFSPSRRCFALAVGAHTLRVWWLDEGLDSEGAAREVAYALEMDTGRMGIVGVSFLDDGRLVVAHGDGCVQGWELTPTGESSDPSLTSEYGDAFPERRPDLEAVGTLRRSGEDPIERASPSLRATLRWELDLEARLESCAFTRAPWGVRCVTGATDGRVVLVDLAPGITPRATLLGEHNTAVVLAALAEDGGRFATASRDRKLGVWRPDELVAPRGDGGAWRVLDESGGEVWAMCFSPSARYMVSGGIDNGVYFWDLKAERALRAESHDHEGWIASLAWSEDERVVASASWDKTIGLFQAGDLKPLYCFEYHTDYVSQVMFVPGTNLLVSSSYDKTVAVWDWRNAELIKVFKGHEDWIQALVWLGDGLFCSASSDRTVRVWSISTMREVATLGEGSADDWLSASLGSSFGLGGLGSLAERSGGFSSRRRVRADERSGPADEVLASLAQVEQHELGDDVSSFIEDEVMVLAAMASERASARASARAEAEAEVFEVPSGIGPRPVVFNDDSEVEAPGEGAVEEMIQELGDVASGVGDDVSSPSVSEDALLIEQALERLSFASDGEIITSEAVEHEESEPESMGPMLGMAASEPASEPAAEEEDAVEEDAAARDTMFQRSALADRQSSPADDEVGHTLLGDPTRELSLADVVKNIDRMKSLEDGATSEELSVTGAPEEAAPEEPVSAPVEDPEASGASEPAEEATPEGGAHDRVTAEGDAVDRGSVPEGPEEPQAMEVDSDDLEVVASEDVSEPQAAPPAPPAPPAPGPRLPRPSLEPSGSRDASAPSTPDEVSEELVGSNPEVADEAESLGQRPSSGLHITPPDALETRYEVEGLGDRISSSVEEDEDSVIESSLATIDPDERSEPRALMGDGPSSLSEPLDSEVAADAHSGPEQPAEEAAEEVVGEVEDEPADEAEEPAAVAAPESDEEASPEPDSDSESEPESEPEAEPMVAVEELAEDDALIEVEDALGQLSGTSSSSVEELATDMTGWDDVGSRLHAPASKMAPASVVADLEGVEFGALTGPRLGAAELTLDHGKSEANQDPRHDFLLDREPTTRFQKSLRVEAPLDPPDLEASEVLRPRQTTREQVRAKLKQRFASGKLSRLRDNLDGELEEGVSPEGAAAEVTRAEAEALPSIAEHSAMLAATAPELTTPDVSEPAVSEASAPEPTPDDEPEGPIPMRAPVVEAMPKAPSFVSATHIERVATAELNIDDMESEYDAILPSEASGAEGPLGDLDTPPEAIAVDPAVGYGPTESERVAYEPTEAEPPPPEERPAVGADAPARSKSADTVERAVGQRKQPSREELDAAFATMPRPPVASAPTPFPGGERRDPGQSGAPMAKFLSPEEVAERSRPGFQEPNLHGTVMGFGSLFSPGSDSPAASTPPPRKEQGSGRELFDVTIAEIWQLRLGQRRAAMKIFKKKTTPVTAFRSWERLEPEVGEVYGIGVGGEVDYFAVCGARTRVDVWAEGERAFSLETQAKSTLQSLAISQDGRVVIAGDEEGGVHLWLLPADPIDDRKASIGHATMGGHTGPVSSIALSSTGKMMITGSLDGTARLWDMVDGSCVAVLTRHRGPVTGVTFTSKGPVTISRDGSLRLWDKRGVLLSEAEGLGDLSAICSRKSKVYVGNAKGEVHAFQRGAIAKVFDVGEPIVSMAMSVEDVGVIGTRKGKVHVFEWGKSELLQELQVGEDVSSVGATDKELLVGTVTGAVEVYRQPKRP
jgi:WD40 repeat protein